MEKIKDFFHNFSDIFFAIVIASIMFAVLTINLGSWFDDSSNIVSADKPANILENPNSNIINNRPDNNVDSENKDNQPTTEDDTYKTDIEIPQNSNDTNPDTNDTSPDINDTSPGTNDTSPDINEDEQKYATIRETKRIVIPSGTFGTGIAQILKENGLIDDSNDFVRAAENLNLSKRLKSGSFEIPVGIAVEDMVKIIAGQRNM